MMRPTVVGILALLALSFAPGAVLAQPRPEEPEDLEGEALSATSIRLVWEEDDGERAVSFNVYRDGDRIGDTTEEEYTDTGLTPSTEYEYWVRGVDSRGREGKRSDKVQVRTLADDTPPAKMSRPLATAVFATRIDLSWAAGSDPESEIAAYRLRRDGTVIATVTGRSYEDDGLKAFTEYEYRVSAINGVGLEGAQSSPLTR